MASGIEKNQPHASNGGKIKELHCTYGQLGVALPFPPPLFLVLLYELYAV
jgi:hypothetical protein